MEYSITQLTRLAGVSGRTLRYYDEIDLLRPMRVSAAGYRIYGQEQVDALQQILFYRELGVELEHIKRLLCAPDFDRLRALESHLAALCERRTRLEVLIANATGTIEHMKGELMMSDKEKFEGFRKRLVEENEQRYGKEVREAYGDAAMDAANANTVNMTQEEYTAWQKLGDEILCALKEAQTTKDPAGAPAQAVCTLHRDWLMRTGCAYSAKYHRALGQMYAEDARFAAYYDAAAPGCAMFLRDAITIFCANGAQE